MVFEGLLNGQGVGCFSQNVAEQSTCKVPSPHKWSAGSFLTAVVMEGQLAQD